MNTRYLTALLITAFPTLIQAHPIPGRSYDRAISVTPTTHGVRIGYQLNIDSTIVFRTMPKLLDDLSELQGAGPEKYYDIYEERMSELIADQLLLMINGEAVKLTEISARHRSARDHHVIFSYLFETNWKPDPGVEYKLRFTELNFPDNPGQLRLNFTPAESLEVEQVVVPSPELLEKAELDLTEEDKEQLRTLSALIRVPGKVVPVPPEPEPTPEPLPPDEPQSIWAKLKSQGLPALFDAGYGVGLLLIIAGIFGAAHALTPGHGKTMVAAYLVGERGTFMHAVILGVVVTLTHTGGVIALASILYVIYPDTMEAQAQQILGFAGGLLIAGLGLWLFLKRVAGQADHVHLFGSHSHTHDHDHDTPHSHSHDHSHDHHHEKKKMPGGRWGLIVLGISGGIIPCWDAVALLGIAITANRLWLGVPLLLAFSLGLALVLMALGMAVVYAKRLGGKKFGDSRWFRLLPILSAFLLIGIGVWLCRDSLRIPVEPKQPVVETEGES